MANVFNRLRAKIARDRIGATVSAVVRYPFTRPPRSPSDPAASLSVQERFERIYESNAWQSQESRSGPGSELGRTENLRKWLVTAIPRYDIQSMIDAPCGDFNWMKHVIPQVEVRYRGLDIVAPLISANTEKYATDRVTFGVADIRRDPLPACDLIMVRDCLFHLSFADVNKVLRNLAKTDYKYLLTTTHTELGEFHNEDIATGEWHLIDLFSAPFGFSRTNVIDAVEDYPAGFAIPRQMILLAKKDVPRRISAR